MDVHKKIIHNTIWLYFSEFVVQILMFFFFIYLAKKVGNEQFGIFNFAFSFVFIFAALINFGMDQLLIRNCSLNNELLNLYISNIFVFRLIMCIFVVLLTLSFSYLFGYPPSTIKVVLIISLFLVLSTMTQLFIFGLRVYENMKYEAIIKIIGKGILTITGIIVLFFGYKVFEISLVYLFSGIISFFFALYFFLKKSTFFRFKFDKKQLFAIIRYSLPFIFLALFYDIYFKVDIILLSFLKGDAITGWYSASTKIIELLIVIPIIFNGVLIPSLTPLFKENFQYASLFYNFISKYFCIITMPILSLILIKNKKIIELIYGQEYLEASLSLLILTIALIFIYMSLLNDTFLVMIKQEKISLLLFGSLSILNIFLNFLIIPKLSLNGAAITTLICNFLYYIISLFILRKLFKTISIKSFIFKLLSLNIILIIIIYILKDINFYLILFIASFIYILGLFIFKIISISELLIIMDILLGKNLTNKISFLLRN